MDFIGLIHRESKKVLKNVTWETILSLEQTESNSLVPSSSDFLPKFPEK